MSKGIFVVLFPIYLVICLYHFYIKQFRSAVFYITPLLAIIASLLFYINSGTFNRGHNDNNFFELLTIAVHSWVQTYAIFFNILTPPLAASIFGTACAIILIFFLIFFLKKQIKKYYLENESISSDLIAIVLFNVLAFGFIFINSTRHIPFSRLESFSVAFLHLPSSRVYFIPVIFIFISLCIFLYKISNKKIRNLSLLLFLIYTSYVFSQYIQFKDDRNFMIEWSDTHSVMTSFNSYCIPTNPFKRVIRKDCKSKKVLTKKTTSYSANELGIEKDQILSLLIEDKNNNNIYVVAYDENNKEITRASAIGASEKKYKYFVFEDVIVFER